MLKAERQNIILEEVRAYNKVHSSDLSKKLDVSEDTIRRDLRELAENGHIKKVHGGAMANPHIPNFLNKKIIAQQSERIVIAKKALSFIKDHQVILLTGGATSEILVDYLAPDVSATIFTNSLPIAIKLFELHSVETFLLGGKLSKKSRETVGMDVIRSLDELHADLCILCTSSIHADIGITEGGRENAVIQKVMMKAASNVITLCLSTHIGRIQPFKVEGIDKIDTLITELEDDPILEGLRSKGVEVI